jgi:hypothetical protein
MFIMELPVTSAAEKDRSGVEEDNRLGKMLDDIITRITQNNENHNCESSQGCQEKSCGWYDLFPRCLMKNVTEVTLQSGCTGVHSA